MALFTRENAAEMARRSVAARATIKLASADPKLPLALPEEIAVVPEKPAEPTYADKRLMRVRVQLNTLDQQLETQLTRAQPNTKAIKELIDAQYRLAEQERFLDGRPAPGQFRPEKARGRQSGRLDTESITVLPDDEPGLASNVT